MIPTAELALVSPEIWIAGPGDLLLGLTCVLFSLLGMCFAPVAALPC